MIPDPVFGGLTIALIFGVIRSVLLTLLMLPLLYRRMIIPHSTNEAVDKAGLDRKILARRVAQAPATIYVNIGSIQ